MLKREILKGLALVTMAGLLSGCAASSASSQHQTASSEKITKAQSKRQKLIKALPKGAKATDPELLVVNKWHKYDELTFSKATVSGITVRKTLVKPLTAFLKGADQAGYPATLVSGYRSVQYQKEVWRESIATYEAQGKSAKQALRLTQEYVAVPRGSEHQTGLAGDIMNSQWFNAHNSQLLSSSDRAKGQQWLINHAPDYGFVLRFPKTGAQSTGIDYESWHFRYVGKKNAAFMAQHHLTLEDYVSLLRARAKAAK